MEDVFQSALSPMTEIEKMTFELDYLQKTKDIWK
jgi:hypothetical protein